ncbi:MAG: hypothetical protein ACPHCN_12105 [Mycobacterium sp.]
MAAAGLIDRTPDPIALCLFGRILTGEEPNKDGHTLPIEDAEWLAEEFCRRPKRGRRTWLSEKLLVAGFRFSHYAIDAHLLGKRCDCPPDTLLRGVNA